MPSIEVVIPNGLDADEFRHRVCMAAMHARYGGVAGFARAIHVNRQSVYYALSGLYSRGRVAGALSTLTGIPLDVLFPAREKAA